MSSVAAVAVAVDEHDEDAFDGSLPWSLMKVVASK